MKVGHNEEDYYYYCYCCRQHDTLAPRSLELSPTTTVRTSTTFPQNYCHYYYYYYHHHHQDIPRNILTNLYGAMGNELLLP